MQHLEETPARSLLLRQAGSVIIPHGAPQRILHLRCTETAGKPFPWGGLAGRGEKDGEEGREWGPRTDKKMMERAREAARRRMRWTTRETKARRGR